MMRGVPSENFMQLKIDQPDKHALSTLEWNRRLYKYMHRNNTPGWGICIYGNLFIYFWNSKRHNTNTINYAPNS